MITVGPGGTGAHPASEAQRVIALFGRRQKQKTCLRPCVARTVVLWYVEQCYYDTRDIVQS